MVGFFFFQAEDGIRDVAVTGVQTCALPIFQPGAGHTRLGSPAPGWMATSVGAPDRLEAKAREAVSCAGVSANPTGPGVRTSGHSRASCANRTRSTLRPRQYFWVAVLIQRGFDAAWMAPCHGPCSPSVFHTQAKLRVRDRKST